MELSGKRVSVIGAGKSGIAAAALLTRKGARVLLSELGTIGEKERSALREMMIDFEHDGHSEQVYNADFCVISPGVTPHSEVVKAMKAKGITIYSEIELASLFCKARIVGITGTDGKTTTSTLVYSICEADGLQHGYRAYSVGNSGVPFCSMVLEMNEGDVAVVELSSYQLERCPTLRPEVAIITNITPDHLDRYDGDINRYAAVKFRISANQRAGDALIYNADDPLLRAHFAGKQGSLPFMLLSFGMDAATGEGVEPPFVFLDEETIVVRTPEGEERIMVTADFLKKSFRGRHNISNVLAAVAASRALGIGNESIRAALREFTGVEHRQEFVMTINGADWVNDSKATNINAMRQALEAVPDSAVLIAGGRDKGNDYDSIAALVRKKVSLLVAIGESQAKIVSAFKDVTAVKTAASLAEAVLFASHSATPGQTVLFSPGCASFDMFENFEDRGRQFKQCVHHLPPC